MTHICDTCKYNTLEWYEEPCDSCCGANSGYEPIAETYKESDNE